jgi:hypothetical protein
VAGLKKFPVYLERVASVFLNQRWQLSRTRGERLILAQAQQVDADPQLAHTRQGRRNANAQTLDSA